MKQEIQKEYETIPIMTIGEMKGNDSDFDEIYVYHDSSIFRWKDDKKREAVKRFKKATRELFQRKKINYNQTITLKQFFHIYEVVGKGTRESFVKLMYQTYINNIDILNEMSNIFHNIAITKTEQYINIKIKEIKEECKKLIDNESFHGIEKLGEDVIKLQRGLRDIKSLDGDDLSNFSILEFNYHLGNIVIKLCFNELVEILLKYKNHWIKLNK